MENQPKGNNENQPAPNGENPNENQGANNGENQNGNNERPAESSQKIGEAAVAAGQTENHREGAKMLYYQGAENTTGDRSAEIPADQKPNFDSESDKNMAVIESDKNKAIIEEGKTKAVDPLDEIVDRRIKDPNEAFAEAAAANDVMKDPKYEGIKDIKDRDERFMRELERDRAAAAAGEKARQQYVDEDEAKRKEMVRNFNAGKEETKEERDYKDNFNKWRARNQEIRDEEMAVAFPNGAPTGEDADDQLARARYAAHQEALSQDAKAKAQFKARMEVQQPVGAHEDRNDNFEDELRYEEEIKERAQDKMDEVRDEQMRNEILNNIRANVPLPKEQQEYLERFMRIQKLEEEKRRIEEEIRQKEEEIEALKKNAKNIDDQIKDIKG